MDIFKNRFRNKLIFSFLFIYLLNFGYAGIEKHLKKIEDKIEESQIRNIDFIYLINLDHRHDRLEKSLSQLNSYGIHPYRFSAIEGKNLSYDALNDIGVKFLPGMEGENWASTLNEEGNLDGNFLRPAFYGKTVFYRWMQMGAIGCSLSHLSILQDAYDAGYKTIWIMEDDIFVKDNPHCLASLIDELDAEVGEDGWDILYTDGISSFHYLTPDEINWWIWRPDLPSSDSTTYSEITIINENFAKIGGRFRTHSMIIRRSGMKKILDFIKTHHIFLPYDHELALAKDIRLFNLRYPLVTCSFEFSSDIHVKNL